MAEEKRKCPLCEELMPVSALRDHLQTEARAIRDHVVQRIRDQHPEWVEADGACPKCWEHYRSL